MTILTLVITACALLWMTQSPGQVEINWFDYSIALSTSWFCLFLAGFILFFCFLLSLKYRWRIFWLKRSFHKQKKRTSRTESLILEGLAAVASRDVHRAKKILSKLGEQDSQTPLALILSAQTAMIAHDTHGAENAFRKLADLPATECMGLRGLALQKAAEGQVGLAHELIESTLDKNPKNPWALETAFDLEIRSREWDQALATLKKLSKLKDAPDLKRKKALLHYELALSQKQKNLGQALTFFETAYDLAPSHAPMGTAYAATLMADQQMRKAKKVIRETWTLTPHPDLAALYVQTVTDSLDQFALMQELYQLAPEGWISRMLYAHYAIQAGMWGMARPQLEGLLQERPYQRVYADLITMENALGNVSQMRSLIAQAAEHGLQNPEWHCQTCGHNSALWHTLCDHCGGFDTQVWESSQTHPVTRTPDQHVLLPGE